METQNRPAPAGGDPAESGQSGRRPAGRPSSAQLRFFQILSAVLIVLLIAAVGYLLYRERKVQPVAVLVGGSQVATVSNLSSAEALIGRLAQSELGSAYDERAQPRPTAPVTYRRLAQDTPIDSEATALNKLSAAVELSVMADVISIGGVPIVALPDQPSAQAALDQVRAYYAALPPSYTLIGKPEFREAVRIDRLRVPAAICKPTAAAAAQLLLTSPPAKQYTVGLHDSGWSIAKKFHLSFSDFLRANPGRDLNDLLPGDTVNVSRSFPPLTVIVHKEHVFTQPIVANEPASIAGLRQVTTIDTYVNGVRTGESAPVSVYTIRRATPHDIVE